MPKPAPAAVDVPKPAPSSVPPHESAQDDDDPDVVDLPDYVAGLSPSKEKALAALIDGKSATYAAVMAAVSRMTVYRWQHHDPSFAAALNAFQRQKRDEFSTRLSSMQEKVLSVISTLLDKGDFRMVKLYFSFLEKQRIGPGTPTGMYRRLARPHVKAARAAITPLLKAGGLPEFREDCMVRYLSHEEAARRLEFIMGKGGESELRED